MSAGHGPTHDWTLHMAGWVLTKDLWKRFLECLPLTVCHLINDQNRECGRTFSKVQGRCCPLYYQGGLEIPELQNI